MNSPSHAAKGDTCLAQGDTFCCFVTGHDFSRAEKAAKKDWALAPAEFLSARTTDRGPQLAVAAQDRFSRFSLCVGGVLHEDQSMRNCNAKATGRAVVKRRGSREH